MNKMKQNQQIVIWSIYLIYQYMNNIYNFKN